MRGGTDGRRLLRGVGEHGCPQGTGDADRTCQTSSRVKSVRTGAPHPPQTPRLAFLTHEAQS